MSIKSLLQLILLLLIFFIIGGIYFLYFYSGPLKNEIINEKEIKKTTNLEKKQKDFLDEEILEEVAISKKKVEEKEDKSQDVSNVFEDKLENSKKNSSETINNLTKEIEYISSNKDGDIFKIIAKYGKTNIEDSNILNLEIVDGIISSEKRSQINISSNYAKYNYDNQNSQFYSDVIIKYDDKVITCDNFDLNINENYAIAYNKVQIKDEKSIMKAQTVTLDLLTKDMKINAEDTIKILKK